MFRPPWSAVDRGTSNPPSDRAHRGLGERRCPPSLRLRKESLRLREAFALARGRGLTKVLRSGSAALYRRAKPSIHLPRARRQAQPTAAASAVAARSTQAFFSGTGDTGVAKVKLSR